MYTARPQEESGELKSTQIRIIGAFASKGSGMMNDSGPAAKKKVD